MNKITDITKLQNEQFYLVALETNPSLQYCRYIQRDSSEWSLGGFFTYRWGYGYNDYIGDWSDTLVVYEA